jgi:hypothetical protein
LDAGSGEHLRIRQDLCGQRQDRRRREDAFLQSTEKVLLHLRHPKSAPMRSVTVNGENWKAFSKDGDAVEMKGLTGTVVVAAHYECPMLVRPIAS